MNNQQLPPEGDEQWNEAEWQAYLAEVEPIVDELTDLMGKAKSETIRLHLNDVIEEISSYVEWEDGEDEQAEAA